MYDDVCLYWKEKNKQQNKKQNKNNNNNCMIVFHSVMIHVKHPSKSVARLKEYDCWNLSPCQTVMTLATTCGELRLRLVDIRGDTRRVITRLISPHVARNVVTVWQGIKQVLVQVLHYLVNEWQRNWSYCENAQDSSSPVSFVYCKNRFGHDWAQILIGKRSKNFRENSLKLVNILTLVHH